MSSSIVSTIAATLTTTTTSNYTYNISQSEQPNSDSGLSAAYIGLIVALIGLASSCLIQYNIKTVKLFCIKFECTKKEEEKKEYTMPEHMVIVSEHMVVVPKNTIVHSEPEPHVIVPTNILLAQEDTFVESTF
jgi:hypothetical protein